MTKKKPGRIGRPPKHGGYCLSFARDELLKREQVRVSQYLGDVRAGIVRDVAGGEDQLSEQQRVMIDRVISRLAICRLIEIYVSKNGAFTKNAAGKIRPELVPALGQNYLSFTAAIDRALIALGLDKKKADGLIDLGRYIDARDAAKDKNPGKGPGKAQDSPQDGPGTHTEAPAGDDDPGQGELGQGEGESQGEA